MVAKITANFRERELLSLKYATMEEIRIIHYHEMLRIEIHEFVSISQHKNLSGLVEATRDRKMELETDQQKRRHDQVHASPSIIKKTRVTDDWFGDRRIRGFCGRCGLTHQGIFRAQVFGCFRCAQEDHYNRDYSQMESRVCFICI